VSHSLSPIDRRFAAWVVGFRKHQGWTQRDLAAAVGRDRVTVARWEGCAAYPDAATRMLLNTLAKDEGYASVPRRWEH
jgi:transcriptional regulator with XRE-family HTH domain